MLVDSCRRKRKLDIRYPGHLHLRTVRVFDVCESIDISFDSQSIRVTITVGVSMCARPEGEVWEAAPVLQVVTTNKF